MRLAAAFSTLGSLMKTIGKGGIPALHRDSKKACNLWIQLGLKKIKLGVT